MFKTQIKSIKSYSQEIGLRKGEWVKVMIDYIVSKICHGFCLDDYIVKGNGYTMTWYEKKRFLTIKRAFRFQDKVNDPNYTHLLQNKAEALALFNDLVSRAWLYVPQSTFDQFLSFVKKNHVFIAKPVRGQESIGIEKHSIVGVSDNELESLYKHLLEEDMLIEECIKTHDDIYLQTTALSTFRVFTMIDNKGEVHVLKAKYRVGIGDAITDASNGLCVHYPISLKYGVIEGPGIRVKDKGEKCFYHPGCDKLVVGLKIPMWNHVLETVTMAAKRVPRVRYIGWDIAITNNSVEIIEGNHNPYHGTFEIMGEERLWWPKLKALI